MEIFKLFGTIMVDNEKANKSISDTDGKAKGFTSSLGKGITTVAKWGAAIGAAAVAGGAALYGMASKAAETTDRIDKLSAKIGLSKQGFQEWDYIMGQNGMEVEKLQVGIKTLVTQMDSAASGSKTAQEAFGKLHLTWNDGNGKLKNQEQMMNEAIIALANMENGTEKARLATQLFGKAGSEMMPMLNGGAEGIEELRKRAHDLGLVISDDAVTAGVVLGDTIDDVKDSFGAITTKIGVSVMPLVQKFLDFILDKMPLIQSVLGVVFKGINFFVGMVVKGFSNLASIVTSKIEPIINTFTKMKDTFNDSMEEFDDYGQAFKSMIEVITGPLGDMPIFEEIGKIFSAIQEVIARISNGEGIGEALRNAFSWRDSSVGNMLLDLMNFVGSIFGSVESIISTVIENVGPIISGLKDLFGILIGYIGTAWESIGKPVFSAFARMVEKIAEVFNYVFPIVAEIFSGICDTLNKLWIEILQPVLQAIGDFVSGTLLPIWETVFGEVGELVKGAFDKISTVWNDVLKPILDGIIDFISGTFSGDWQKAWDGIVSIFTGIWNGIVDVVKGIVNKTIIKGINFVISGINKVGFDVPDFLGGGHVGFDINPMPEWYAEGAILTKPTAFGFNPYTGKTMVGGEKEAEAIAPLSKLAGFIQDAVRKEVNFEIDYNSITNCFIEAIKVTGMNNMGIYMSTEKVGQALGDTNDEVGGYKAALSGRRVGL